ncbi:MAG TPA: hypothetical protein VH008_03980 [Pseudonocardia sp.]|nr:hypothetical protein [Pseudonocardia sp.]
MSLDGALALAAHHAPRVGRGLVVGGPTTAEESTRRLDSAEAIAGNPRLWRTLLFAHAPNLIGECHACRGVRWPCGTRTLAEQAEQIHTAG